MSTFETLLLASDDTFYQGPCESLIVPTVQGAYGVLAHHSNTVAAVIPGELYYRLPGEEMQIASISSGIMKIENNQVMILVETIERPEDIDSNRAKRAAEAAREALLQKQSLRQYRMTQAYLARALARLRVSGEWMKGS